MATSNFIKQNNVDLWAADFYMPVFPLDKFGNEDTTDGPIDYYFDEVALAEAQEKIDEINTTLRFYKLTLKDGYYAGIQIFVDDSSLPDYDFFTTSYDFSLYEVNRYILLRMIRAELNRINKSILPAFKNYGFLQYNIAAQFSNGETHYYEVA